MPRLRTRARRRMIPTMFVVRGRPPPTRASRTWEGDERAMPMSSASRSAIVSPLVDRQRRGRRGFRPAIVEHADGPEVEARRAPGGVAEAPPFRVAVRPDGYPGTQGGWPDGEAFTAQPGKPPSPGRRPYAGSARHQGRPGRDAWAREGTRAADGA